MGKGPEAGGARHHRSGFRPSPSWLENGEGPQKTLERRVGDQTKPSGEEFYLYPKAVETKRSLRQGRNLLKFTF